MASLENFRKQYGENGIYAGKRHFKAYWARDSLFACFGALALGDHEQVRKTVENLLANLAYGHVPLRIGYLSQLRMSLGVPAGQGVVHGEDKHGALSIDANALLLIVAEKYEIATHGKFDREKLRAVVDWLVRQEKNHLLNEAPFTSWEDSLSLRGPRLYANVCYYRAMLSASKLLRDPSYAARAVQIKLQIRRWWKENYFMDGPSRDVCMVAGNLLAILWGLADPKQSRATLEYIGRRTSVCPPAGFFHITKKEGYGPLFLIGLGDYHALGVEWSWLACVEIACYRANGDVVEAQRREEKLRELFSRSGGACEVYENDKPLRRLFYKTETNFAWTLGLLIASRPSTLSVLR